jgi:hypothetical protein
MDRRSFLRLCTASVLLKLGPIAELARVSNGRFMSRSLGFSFEFPAGWRAMTLEDELNVHFAEWGGLSPDAELPVVVLSRFPEPTARPNYQMHVYVCDTSEVGTITRADSDLVCGSFEDILGKQQNFIGFVEKPLQSTDLPFDCFGASFRTHGVDKRQRFFGCVYLWYKRQRPLLIVTCIPENGDNELLKQVLRTFNTA